MYSTAIVASAALMASSALAGSVGSAVVINKCNYPVYLSNVPAANKQYTEIDKTLSANGDLQSNKDGTYTQQWTELPEKNGWSLKLSKVKGSLSNIMQYEYTFQNDGNIWFDASDVDGNPWNGDWEFVGTSPSSVCTTKNQAYRYSTDDAYGMQWCPQDSTVTLTLCSGESQNDGGAASASSSAAAQSSAASTKPSVAPPSSTPVLAPTSASSPAPAKPTVSPSTSSYARSSFAHNQFDVVNAASPTLTTTQPTTLSTSVTVVTTSNQYGATVTEIETAIVTDVVTATYYEGGQKRSMPMRRHEHQAPRHPHGRF